MKKILLLCVFALLGFVAFAQTKENTIDSLSSSRIIEFDRDKVLTAIGDSRFEMTWDEAIECDVFNQRKPRFTKNKRAGFIIANEYELGIYGYRVICTFEDNLLDEVSITSYPLSAQYWDSNIRNYFRNLKDIFLNAYGDPYLDPGFPNILQYEEKQTMWIYGEKVITLSIEEDDRQYYASIEIHLINNRTIDRMQKDLQEIIGKESEASELF